MTSTGPRPTGSSSPAVGRRAIRSRGLLGQLRHDASARLFALLALFAYALIGISPLWVPAVAGGGIEVCTGDGIRIIPGDPPVSDPASGPSQAKRSCPLCTIQAASLLVPTDCWLASVDEGGAAALVGAQPSRGIAELFTGFAEQSRAPPLPA